MVQQKMSSQDRAVTIFKRRQQLNSLNQRIIDVNAFVYKMLNRVVKLQIKFKKYCMS